MPRAKTTTGSTPANKQKGKKVCSCCHEEKKMTDFYISKSPLFSIDERVPVCKTCVINSSLNEDGTINELELNKILRKIDKPYYKDLIESGKSQFKKEHSYIDDEKIDFYGKEILGFYFKNIAMRQDINKSYDDSEKDGFMHQNSNTTVSKKEEIAKKYADLSSNQGSEKDVEQKKEEIISLEDDSFDVTQDIIELFGDGYTRSEYKKMFEKYEKLKLNYSLQTNLHQEALATYVRFKVKEEEATASGNVDEAKKWYDAAQNAASNGKLTPKQLTKADLDSGVNSISEIAKAVEQAVDVIKILPKFKYRPNDAPDFNIWCYVDYERKLNDQPSVPYDEIYKFYDKKREEYLSQNGDPYGIFSNEPTLKNRDTVKTFIALPDDYEDMAGEDDG